MKKKMKRISSVVLGSMLVVLFVLVASGFVKSEKVEMPEEVEPENIVIEETTEEVVTASIQERENEEVEAFSEETVIVLIQRDYEDLMKIVQAEAGGEDEKGKILVANVIINRVNSSRFPNSYHEVIFAPGQFNPVQYGSFHDIQPSEATRIAVDKALSGEDYSQGALFFCANSVRGVLSHYTLLFQHGGHSFFV